VPGATVPVEYPSKTVGATRKVEVMAAPGREQEGALGTR
jgi:hypothetical protein